MARPLTQAARDRLRAQVRREQELAAGVLASESRLEAETEKRNAAIAAHDRMVAARADDVADALIAYVDESGVGVERAAIILGPLKERTRSHRPRTPASNGAPNSQELKGVRWMASESALTAWADTSREQPPRDHLYGSAIWLLGRHPRLARLAVRIAGVVDVEDGELCIDLDHLAEVIAAVPRYIAAWHDYEARSRQPDDESEWYLWRDAGPAPSQFAEGLSDFLVMSSGEDAAVRLLAIFATQRAPFRVGDLRSLDDEGQRLLADWSIAVQASCGVRLARPTDEFGLDVHGRSGHPFMLG